MSERVAFYAISSNLVIYLTTVLREDISVSARNVNNWSGTTFMTPLIGAFIADAYLGRYLTLATFSCGYFLVSMVLVSSTINENTALTSIDLWSILLKFHSSQTGCCNVKSRPLCMLRNSAWVVGSAGTDLCNNVGNLAITEAARLSEEPRRYEQVMSTGDQITDWLFLFRIVHDGHGSWRDQVMCECIRRGSIR